MRLTVNGRVFNYPDPGTEIGWGEDATAWAEEVTNTIDNLDTNIPIQFTALLNPSQTNANVANLEVDATSISMIIQYIITNDTTVSLYETGNLYLQNNGTWTMNKIVTSSTLSGISLSCTAGGQVQYTSLAYTGDATIVFKNISLIEGP